MADRRDRKAPASRVTRPSRASRRAGTSRASSKRRVSGAARPVVSDDTSAVSGISESFAAAGADSAAVGEAQDELVSTSVGEIRRRSRNEELQQTSRKYFRRLIVVIGIIVAFLAGWAALYNSHVFAIQNVVVNGVEHLTSDEMAALANVPADTTLLRVDVETIADRVKQNSWVEDVKVRRVFPDTLAIDVTERAVAAIAEIPVESGGVKMWAIAQDHMWLMPIPDAGSDAASTTSAKIYEDAAAVRHIVNLPYGTKAEIGQICSDDVVENALSILDGMTTDLVDQVAIISAASVAETTLLLQSGVEIAFGAAEDIRDKERVIQKILEENPDGVAYINVRIVENPTWRAI